MQNNDNASEENESFFAANLLGKLYLWPPFKTLRKYPRHRFRFDFMAALLVTAIAIPESLGFAAIVGLPLQTGLYCALLAPLFFAAFSSSRRLIVGADSATAALVAAGASTIAIAGTPDYVGAVALLGLLTGVILLLMALLRFGFLADLISSPVLSGFLTGVGLQLVIGKLPDMLGLESSGGLLEKIGYVSSNLSQASVMTAVLSFATVGFILFLAKNRPRWPAALVALVVVTALATVFGLRHHGAMVIGAVPSGLPGFRAPSIGLDRAQHLFFTALSIAFVILVQSTAVSRRYAAKHDEDVNDNQDLLALGMANIASAATGGFAINGSPPRTSASDSIGGHSQMVNVLMALIIASILLFATDLLRIVPIAVIAAIVFVVGLHLIKYDELKEIFLARRSEFYVAVAAMAAVATLGVELGVVLAVIISIIERLRRQARPIDQVLLRDQELSPWAAKIFDESYRPKPGVLIYRFSESIFFENATYFLNRVKSAVKGAKKPVLYVIIQADAINDIDYTAARAITQLWRQLDADDICLMFARVSPELRDLMDHYGITNIIGKENIHSTLHTTLKVIDAEDFSIVKLVNALHLPTSNYIVVGSGVMDALGMRKANKADIVVSKKEYSRLRRSGWEEFTYDDGKKVLFSDGYEVMQRWLSHDLSSLRGSGMTIDGINFINLDKLVECKKKMNRQRDRKDIKLIQKYKEKELAKTIDSKKVA